MCSLPKAPTYDIYMNCKTDGDDAVKYERADSRAWPILHVCVWPCCHRVGVGLFSFAAFLFLGICDLVCDTMAVHGDP